MSNGNMMTRRMAQLRLARRAKRDAAKDVRGGWIEHGWTEEALRNHLKMAVGESAAYRAIYATTVVQLMRQPRRWPFSEHFRPAIRQLPFCMNTFPFDHSVTLIGDALRKHLWRQP